MVKYCTKCGKENQDTSAFCESCGESFNRNYGNYSNRTNNQINTPQNMPPVFMGKRKSNSDTAIKILLILILIFIVIPIIFFIIGLIMYSSGPSYYY